MMNPQTKLSEYRILTCPETQWGALYQPVAPQKPKPGALRLVLFISCNCGVNLLNNLYKLTEKRPGTIHIAGVATDDPTDPAARITLRKRVWNEYTHEQCRELKEKMITNCLHKGIPCYTGAVKTEYFRQMYREWDPDVLIMFCFGQKLDPFIYEYPVMGAYNLHPSDLPKKIGAGTQPFQNAIRNGLKSSPLVIHQITELIDMGPIVGVSPPVNFCLADGSYPASILTLLEKITNIGGWMSVELVLEILKRKQSGNTGATNQINFDGIIPESVREFLSSPATNDLTRMYEVPPHPSLM